VVDEVLSEADQKMKRAVAHTQDEFAGVRTGRASPLLVEKLKVDYYGAETLLQQLAGFSVPEPRMLVISPYDRNAISNIEKAIRASDLGLNPSNDGHVIRLLFPQLTQERRKELVKLVHHRAEEGRVAVRNIRRSSRDDLEVLESEAEISIDELRRAEKKLQEITDRHVHEIDEALKKKEQELLEV
jgi:ribosome recycling factor